MPKSIGSITHRIDFSLREDEILKLAMTISGSGIKHTILTAITIYIQQSQIIYKVIEGEKKTVEELKIIEPAKRWWVDYFKNRG